MLLDGGPGRLDERGLQAAGGVEVIAGPDHAHGGGGGLAVRAAQVVADGVDEPGVGGLVVGQRLG